MGVDRKQTKYVFHPIYLLFAIIMWVLVVLWLGVIFSLSAETGDVSALRSQSLVDWLSGAPALFTNEYLLRKSAHIVEFLILSVLAYVAMFATKHIQSDVHWDGSQLIQIKSDNEVYIAFSLWITTLSAVADEYHQIFVPGRSSSLFDVFLDLSGAFTLMLIIRVIVSIHVYLKDKQNPIEMSAS
ncbi:MAG: VanZ family protein [Clostridiales bacterium]|nr:VanZ family protein [Clostridiales bacterium]